MRRHSASTRVTIKAIAAVHGYGGTPNCCLALKLNTKCLTNQQQNVRSRILRGWDPGEQACATTFTGCSSGRLHSGLSHHHSHQVSASRALLHIGRVTASSLSSLYLPRSKQTRRSPSQHPPRSPHNKPQTPGALILITDTF